MLQGLKRLLPLRFRMGRLSGWKRPEPGRRGAEAGPDDWNALDVKLVDRGGREQLLCSIEYEDMKGLRTLVYDDESAEPVFVQKNGFDGEIPAEDEGARQLREENLRLRPVP